MSIAVAQPVCVALDPAANARSHAAVVRRARARVVVFPELSLTGYELGAATVDLSDEPWEPLVQACARTGTLALVGAPIAEGGREHIAIVAVSSQGVRVAYRKSWPGGDEPPRFSPGPGPVALDVDGWRLGLGICRDTGVSEHVDATAALGVDVFVAGLADVPGDLEVQRERARHIAAVCGAHVAFASFAGPTGRGYERTAGCSAVYSPGGAVIDGCGADAGELARVTIS